MVHLDQSKDFDRVDHRYIMSTLAQFGLDLDFLRWIISIYDNIDSVVRVNDILSNLFRIKRSFRQGCSLSPLLCIVALDPLL